ncbi:hypothetical protein DYB31_016496 [Aphanomyces astaci]|uniref:Uncharacterized protein n=1 Tax=Aphanomyces astaci TaxID=112090 RepID=A0A397EIF8_APHAT|nr:hypothetical protein DYB31_016496 [Aphanomyces astaci]
MEIDSRDESGSLLCARVGTQERCKAPVAPVAAPAARVQAAQPPEKPVKHRPARHAEVRTDPVPEGGDDVRESLRGGRQGPGRPSVACYFDPVPFFNLCDFLLVRPLLSVQLAYLISH